MEDRRGHQVVRATMAPSSPLRLGRGRSQHLVAPRAGVTEMTVSRVTIEPFKVPGPLHLHRHANNVYVVLDGQLEVTSGPTVYMLGPGDSILIPSGEAHSTHNPTNAPVVLMAIYDRSVEDDFITVEDASQDRDEPALQFRIDSSRCIGSGECVLAAPEVFDIGPEGVAILRREAPLLDRSKAAILVGNCPSGALRLVEPASS